MKELCKYTDAANIDLKSMRDKFYRDVCDATLKPVLDTLVLAKDSGVMVEVTNLIITSLNDSDNDLKMLCQWVFKNLGVDTSLHFSRFHPNCKIRKIAPTSSLTLKRASENCDGRRSKICICWQCSHKRRRNNLLSEMPKTTY
ncbi:MAG: hypothetical protein U9O87_04475 [Verrucomicrobiota bacterium]|nr:hypothetical protein [Verrucomicrobiota bacterium]